MKSRRSNAVEDLVAGAAAAAAASKRHSGVGNRDRVASNVNDDADYSSVGDTTISSLTRDTFMKKALNRVENGSPDGVLGDGSSRDFGGGGGSSSFSLGSASNVDRMSQSRMSGNLGSLPRQNSVEARSMYHDSGSVNGPGGNLSRRSVGITDAVVSESERNKKRQLGSLRFDRLDVFGRKEEKQQLLQAMKCVMAASARIPPSHNDSNTSEDDDHKKETRPADGSNPNASDESSNTTPPPHSPSTPLPSRPGNGLVLISGVSGIGKSHLTKYLQKATKKSNGLYVQGQYDMTSKGEPYEGIKSACLQVCGELIYQKKNNRRLWSSVVRDLMALPELGQVLHLIPDLQDCLLDDQKRNDSRHNHLMRLAKERANTTNERSALKLNEAFRRFVRVICSYFTPFVMVLDDLQRAENQSLQLIQSIVSDAEGSGLLVVGTYRSNEVDENHPVSRFIEGMMLSSEDIDSGLTIFTQLPITNFTESEVKDIVIIVLNMNGDEEGLDTLASICYKRTLGNMFYLGRFIRTLKDDGLIQFNVALWSWKWDLAAIMNFSEASDNVVDFMRSQLLELPPAIQKRLSIAAFLGSTFDVESEAVVWNSLTNSDEDTEDWLEVSKERGILEEYGDGHYRWAHDQVLSSARLLIPESELRKYEVQTARALLEGLSDHQRDFYTFTIVDLLNSDKQSDDKSDIEMAILNRNATKKAADLVGLESMRHYAANGIKSLPANSFQHDSTYELSIDLYSYAMEAANLLSDKEELVSHMAKIQLLSNRPLKDKMRAFKAWILYLVRQKEASKTAEGLSFAIDLLGELGVKFPKRKTVQLVATLKGLMKVKSKAKAVTVDEVVNDKRPVDPTDLQAMQILSLAMEAVFLVRPEMLPLWILKFAELSFRNGVCEYTQVSYAQLAMVFRLVNDYRLATKMAEITEKLLRTFQFDETWGQAAYQIYSFPLPYTRPYHESVPGLMDSYSHSLAVGDLSALSATLVFLCFTLLSTGTKLQVLNADCRRYVHQLKELKSEQAEVNLRTLWQCVLNLLGSAGTDDPCVLVGPALSEEQANSITLDSGKACLFYLPCFLCAVFANYERGAELAIDNDGKFEKALSGAGSCMHEAFIAGVNVFAMARKTRKRKFKKAGKRYLSAMRTWAKNDNPNVLHHLQFFEAELAAINGKLDTAEVLYHKSLALARRSGFYHDAAIINERYARFFLEVRMSPDDAYYQMEEACKLYEEWGCQLKADLLRRQYSWIQQGRTPQQKVITVRQK